MDFIDMDLDFDFDSDSDSQQTNDPNLLYKTFNNFEYNYDLFENRINNYSNKINNEIIVNDVFLDQNNQSFEPFIDYENNFSNEDIDGRSDDLESERESGFEEFLDDFCESTESLANTSMFGCICCNSCQNKSKDFIRKTNQLIQHFKRQIKDFKDNVKQHLNEFNSHINSARLDFNQLLMDLQIKLNEKNSQLERILDLSQYLSHNYDSLLCKSKTDFLKFESVCKENIKFRKKLGIDIRIVISSDERKKAMEKLKQNNTDLTNNIIKKTDKDFNNIIDVDMDSSDNRSQSSGEMSPLNTSNDIELRIKSLINKYEKSGYCLKIKKRSPPRSRSSQRKKFASIKVNDNNRRLRNQGFNNSGICSDSFVISKAMANIDSPIRSNPNLLTPITTYSNFNSNDKQLMPEKPVQRSVGCSTDDLDFSRFNNINRNDNYRHMSIDESSSNHMNSVNKYSSCNSVINHSNTLTIHNRNANNNNLMNKIKVEPEREGVSDNFVKSLNNNGLKIKIKLPKVKKEKSSKPLTENKKHCKRCNSSFPDLTTRQFADHIYNVCPARELLKTPLLKCDLCPREFITSSALSSHKRTKHAKEIEANRIPFVMTDSII